MMNWFKRLSTKERVIFSLLFIIALVAICMNPQAVLAFPVMFGATKVVEGMNRVGTIKYTHTSATTKDTVYLLGGRPMLAINSALANAANVFVHRGRIKYTKETGQAWTAGVTLYWDNTNSRFTTTATSNTKSGIAAEDAASADTEGIIELMPEVTA